ncbi:hypothetical protein C4D60_Mb04t30820 [Musa balbisiana]|uniref:Uncharacterized protein n=1 Tax=Musa balbisiana TaxID=52838 RepID=A0A4S8KFV1_MUSBA|nr:hypothetical protein C4D60_Mb04t30820 [Musa balbisiana]
MYFDSKTLAPDNMKMNLLSKHHIKTSCKHKDVIHLLYIKLQECVYMTNKLNKESVNRNRKVGLTVSLSNSVPGSPVISHSSNDLTETCPVAVESESLPPESSPVPPFILWLSIVFFGLPSFSPFSLFKGRFAFCTRWVSALIFHKSKVALEKKLHLIVDKKLGADRSYTFCSEKIKKKKDHLTSFDQEGSFAILQKLARQ